MNDIMFIKLYSDSDHDGKYIGVASVLYCLTNVHVHVLVSMHNRFIN